MVYLKVYSLCNKLGQGIKLLSFLLFLLRFCPNNSYPASWFKSIAYNSKRFTIYK